MNDNVPAHLRNLCMTDRHLWPLRPRRRRQPRRTLDAWADNVPRHQVWRGIVAALIIFWGGFFAGVFSDGVLEQIRQAVL